MNWLQCVSLGTLLWILADVYELNHHDHGGHQIITTWGAMLFVVAFWKWLRERR